MLEVRSKEGSCKLTLIIKRRGCKKVGVIVSSASLLRLRKVFYEKRETSLFHNFVQNQKLKQP